MNGNQLPRPTHIVPRQVEVHWRGKWHPLPQALGLAQQEQSRGNFQSAAELYQLLLAKLPDQATIHINYGVALKELNRTTEALASLDRALALQPNQAEAHNNRGAVLYLLERYDEALASYDRALALKPDYANAHHNRGSTLNKLSRPAEALASYDRAIALNPRHAEAHNNRGVVLQELRQIDEALASFDQAIILNPRHAEACNNRGLNLVIKGDMPAAEKMFRQASALRPDFADPLFNLTTICKYRTPENDEVKHIRTLLAHPGNTADQKELLYYSLGKIYDDCHHYDEAFENYQLANQIRNARVSYNAAAVTRQNQHLMEVFNQDFLARKFAFASANPSPLFIIGMPRSGTTLLASILSNHPAITTAGELSTMTDLTTRLTASNGNNLPYPEAVNHLNPDVAHRLINDFLQSLRQNVDPHIPFVIDKNPLNFVNLGFIALLFPQARIIHCHRHPLDTSLSNYFRRFPLTLDYCFDLQNIGHYYLEYLKVMEHWRKVLPLKMIEINYEDTVLQTESTTRKMLDFLGLNWEARCLAPHANPRVVATASQWQVRQPIYRHALERWRSYEKHLGPLKKMLRPALPTT
jgi:tetratricopeptide (TPR) repeat protein